MWMEAILFAMCSLTVRKTRLNKGAGRVCKFYVLHSVAKLQIQWLHLINN